MGVYHNDLIGNATVTLAGGRLRLAFGNPAFGGPLVPWNHDTFRVTWKNPLFGKSYVSFALDALAHPEALRLSGLSAVFERVRAPTSRTR